MSMGSVVVKKGWQRAVKAVFPVVLFLAGVINTEGAVAALRTVADDSTATMLSSAAMGVDDTPGVRILLVAAEEAVLSARFFGTITRIGVEEGETFTRGAKLVSFDCNELAADRAVARATLKLHTTTSEANEELHVRQVVGDLENDLAKIRVEEAVARTKAYSTRMRNCSLVAPFDGQVVRLDANEHESLQPGTPIMLIQNPKLINAELHVPSRWLQWLKSGTSFRAHIEETGKSYQAVVDHIGVRVDPVSRTIKIYASLPGSHRELLPGMSGYAEFELFPATTKGQSVDEKAEKAEKDKSAP